MLYLALCTADPGEAATGASLTEPGSNYARKSCDVWDTAASRATENTNQVLFDTATGAWGDISHWAIVDSASGAGNVLAYGSFSVTKTVGNTDTFSVAAGDLDISVDSGAWSNYLANAILDHLFEGTAYTPATNLYIALCTAAPGDSDTGSTITEHSGDGYARELENSWDAAASGASENTDVITFGPASASWGTVTHFALCDALTDGNLLLYGTLDDSRAIGTNDEAEFAAGAFDVTLD